MRKIFVSFVLNNSVTGLSEGKFKNAVVEIPGRIRDEEDIKVLQKAVSKKYKLTLIHEPEILYWRPMETPGKNLEEWNDDNVA